jgi:hypothetical protein
MGAIACGGAGEAHLRLAHALRFAPPGGTVPMRTLTATVLAILLTAPVAFAQKTSYDYDKSANFGNYKTYTLKEGTKVGDPLVDARLVAAIDMQLTNKGLVRADNGDVAVVYHIAIDKQKDISAYSTGGGYGPYGYGWGGGWGMSTTDVRVRDILVGTLVIDIADQKTNNMVWRGIGVKEINTQTSPEKRDKSVQKAVEKILKNYPPKPKK